MVTNTNQYLQQGLRPHTLCRLHAAFHKGWDHFFLFHTPGHCWLISSLWLTTSPSPFLNSCSLGPWSMWCVCTVNSSCPACVHIELHTGYFKCQDHLQIWPCSVRILKKNHSCLSQALLRPQKDFAGWSRGWCWLWAWQGLPGTSWVMNPGKGSHCAELCVHMSLISPPPSYGKMAHATMETLPSPTPSPQISLHEFLEPGQ